MKLYVCYGTWKPAPRPGGHPCGHAYHALKDAGHSPEVKRSYGLGLLPFLNFTSGRREVRQLTGNDWVPVLVLDDGTVIQGSRKIMDWAAANPAGSSTAGGTSTSAAATDPTGSGSPAGATDPAGFSGPAASTDPAGSSNPAGSSTT